MTAPASPPPSAKRIIVASFSTTDGAKGGLERLKGAGTRLGNAALIQRLVDGRVEFSETKDWGIAAILLPGIGLFAGAIAGGLAAHFVDAGFPDPLLKQMGSGIAVGTSLIVALVEDADIAHAERVLVESGATVLGSGLEADLAKAMSSLS